MTHLTRLILLFGLVSLGARAAGQVDSVSIEEAKRFLHQYAEYSYLQSAQIAELYSDRAAIRVYGHGQATERRLDGRIYKQWLRDRLLARAIVLDASQFKNVRIERRGSRLVIQANRYAANRCYTDPSYLVGLEREGGRWLVVEEAITTQPHAHCSLASTPAIAVAPKTPILAPSAILQAIPNSQAPWAAPLRNLYLPSSPPEPPVGNDSFSSQTALLAQRAAEARAIAQQMAASYEQAWPAAPEANRAQQVGRGLGAVRPLGRLGTSPPAGSSLWVTPD